MSEVTKEEEEAYHNFVLTPTEANTAFYQLSQHIANSRGIVTGSAVLDKLVLPTRPGWYRYLLARPGEGKTTMLMAIAVNEAKWLVKNRLTHLYYVAHVTWEEAADSQEVRYQLSRGYSVSDFWDGLVGEQAIIAGGMERPNLPIYMLGDSMMKTTVNSLRMTIQQVIHALMAIYKIEGKKPSVLILDYAQEIDVESKNSGQKRTEDVIQAIRDVLYLAIKFKCPVEIGVQAKQTSLDRKVPIPDHRDIEWSFFIHQKATNGIALWRPWVTEKDKPSVRKKGTINVGGREWAFSPNLMVAKPLKSRHSLLGLEVPFKLYADTLTIEDFPGVLTP